MHGKAIRNEILKILLMIRNDQYEYDSSKAICEETISKLRPIPLSTIVLDFLFLAVGTESGSASSTVGEVVLVPDGVVFCQTVGTFLKSTCLVLVIGWEIIPDELVFLGSCSVSILVSASILVFLGIILAFKQIN